MRGPESPRAMPRALLATTGAAASSMVEHEPCDEAATGLEDLKSTGQLGMHLLAMHLDEYKPWSQL